MHFILENKQDFYQTTYFLAIWLMETKQTYVNNQAMHIHVIVPLFFLVTKEWRAAFYDRVAALDYWISDKINLYSNYTANKLQALK